MSNDVAISIEDVLKTLVAVKAGPALSFLGSQAAKQILKKRLDDAAATLRRKMAHGRPWRFRENETASLVFDFLRAAENGTAKRNLEVMADLIANGVSEQGFVEEDVRHLMRTVASLSYDELRLLAGLIRAIQWMEKHATGDFNPLASNANVWINTIRMMTSDDAEISAKLYVTAGALTRTGLVMAEPALGGMIFHPTMLLLQLQQLSPLSDVT